MQTIRRATFTFSPFSRKQMKVLTWWDNESTKDYEAIICDGSVRAGKTAIMSLSYILWSMTTFDDQQFGIAGKTIGSLRRNVIRPLKQMLAGRGYLVKDRRGDNMLEISRAGVTNYYYMFGGKDEGSQDLVQGLTAAGFFFDEVALMPESFVNQATARVSVTGGKYWFNMNPEGPYHWFKQEWIDKAEQKHALHIHFVMEDNPSLSDEVKARYERTYSGVFYQRFILGLWVLSDGVVYSNFDRDKMVMHEPMAEPSRYVVSCDYGTMNPTVFLLWGKVDKVWCLLREFYFDGRHHSTQRTDDQYADDLAKFVGDIKCPIVLDPSATSFRTKLTQRGFRVFKADNDVLTGIRETQSAMNTGKIMFAENLPNTFKEFSSYIWDDKASQRGEDQVVKQHDHAMDAMRYFVMFQIAERNNAQVFSHY